MIKSMARTATRALLSAVTLSAALTAAAGCTGSKTEPPAPVASAPAAVGTGTNPAPTASAPAAPAVAAAVGLAPVAEPANKAALPTKPGPGAVAVVNGVEISDTVFADDLAAASLFAKAATEKGRREVLDNRINFLLEVQDARRLGFPDRPMVKRMIERARRRYVVQEVKREIAEEAAKIPPEQVNARVDSLPKKYYDLTVILTEELEEGQKAIARIKAGEDMEAVAREVSTSPGIGTGNSRRLGYVPGGGMYPPDAETAIGALAVGEISEPLTTPVGFLIVRLDTIRDVPENEKRKARERILQDFFSRRSNERVREILEKETAASRRTILLEKIADAKLPAPTANPMNVWIQFEDVRMVDVDGTVLTLGDVFTDASDYTRFLKTASLQATYEEQRARAVEEVLLGAYGRRQGYDKLPRVETAMKDVIDSLLASLYVGQIVLAQGELEQISDAAAQAHFKAHPERFPSPDVLTLSQILVRREADAEAARDRLRAGGDFAALAKELSADPSAKQGGDLGTLSGPDLDKLGGKEMAAELVARAKKKDFGPFTLRTTAGYHVIVIRGYVPAGSADFASVREQVRKDFWGTSLQQATVKRLADLRAAGVVAVDDRKLMSIQPGAAQPGGFSSPHGNSMNSPRGPSPHAGKLGDPKRASPHGGH